MGALSLFAALPGCGSLVTRGPTDYEEQTSCFGAPLFAAVAEDLDVIGGSTRGSCKTAVLWPVMLPVYVISLPIDLVVDVVLLPFDAIAASSGHSRVKT